MTLLKLALMFVLTIVCVWSALAYWRARQAIASALVLGMLLSVCGIAYWDHLETYLRTTSVARLFSSGTEPKLLQWDSDRDAKLSQTMVQQAVRSDRMSMSGDGLRAAQWKDLPARPLTWQTPEGRERLQILAPLSVNLGRELSIQLSRALAKDQTWSAQLLAENGSVLSEQKAAGQELVLHWMPPRAERLVLQLKVFDQAGKLIDQGPFPIEVKTAVPLRVSARFDAASFDISSLKQLLQESEAQLDWQTRMGQTVQQVLSPLEAIKAPQLIVVDASYWEQASAVQRQSYLQQVAAGASLLVLGANARNPQMWREVLGLQLQDTGAANASAAPEFSFDLSSKGSAATVSGPLKQNRQDRQDKQDGGVGTTSQSELFKLSMSKTRFQAQENSQWKLQSVGGSASTASSPILMREWQAGRIVWLGVADWHRYRITAPENLKRWWQVLMDKTMKLASQAREFSVQEVMPIVGERSILCVDADGDIARILSPHPDSQAKTEPPSLQWQTHVGDITQRCTVWRPRVAGWQVFTLVAEPTSSKVAEQSTQWLYVYPADAWPTWQRALKHQATIAYQDRSPVETLASVEHLPRWPLIMLVILICLLIWRLDTRDVRS